MATFAIIEAQLRIINDNRLIKEFTQSKELQNAPVKVKRVIESVVNTHKWDDRTWDRLLVHCPRNSFTFS